MNEMQKELDKALKELDSAYGILSTMLVSRENVQKLAAAESKIQRVYNDLKALSEKKEGTDNG